YTTMTSITQSNGAVHEHNRGVSDAALSYAHSGRSPVPILHGTKYPSLPQAPRGIAWKQQQQRITPDQDIARWFVAAEPMGVGIVCGKVSGRIVDGTVYGLEVLDFDDETTLGAFLTDAEALGLGACRTPGV